MNNCYCGESMTYENCCGLLHSKTKAAITSAMLMRSRYSAFVTANGNYLLETHASSTKHSVNKKELEKWAKSVKWVKLEILDCVNGNENDLTGEVEFIAHYKEKIFKRKIHERSTFIKEDGKWKYLNGIHI